jgi:hypothetical protein
MKNEIDSLLSSSEKAQFLIYMRKSTKLSGLNFSKLINISHAAYYRYEKERDLPRDRAWKEFEDHVRDTVCKWHKEYRRVENVDRN